MAMMRRRHSVLLLLVGLALCAAWWMFLLPVQNSFPVQDDVNFFIPLLEEYERTGELSTLARAQGPHLHFGYKASALLLSETTGYDVRVWAVLGPLVVLAMAVVIWRHAMRTYPGAPGWARIALAIALPLALFAPARARDFDYDMLATNGHLTVLGGILIAASAHRYIETGQRLWGLIAAGVFTVFVMAIATFKTFVLAFLMAVAAVALFNRSWVFGSPESSQDRTAPRIAVVAGILVAFWLVYNLMLSSFGPAASPPNQGELFPTGVFQALWQGVHQSYGGDEAFKGLDIVGEGTVLRATVFLLAALGALAALPALLRARDTLALTLFATPVLGAVGSYLLRGSAELPRYSGFLSLFWVGMVLAAFAVTVSPGVQEKAHRLRPVLLALPLLALVGATFAQVGMARESLTARPFVAKYYDGLDALYARDPATLSEAEMKRLCARPRDICESSIRYVQDARGIVPISEPGATP